AAAVAALRRPLQLHTLWPHQRRPSRQPARCPAVRLPQRSVLADGLLARRALSLWPRLAAALQWPLAAGRGAGRKPRRLHRALQATRRRGAPAERLARLAD